MKLVGTFFLIALLGCGGSKKPDPEPAMTAEDWARITADDEDDEPKKKSRKAKAASTKNNGGEGGASSGTGECTAGLESFEACLEMKASDSEDCMNNAQIFLSATLGAEEQGEELDEGTQLAGAFCAALCEGHITQPDDDFTALCERIRDEYPDVFEDIPRDKN